ncbi:hypothetical protein DICVIV_09250 [Dictyocaulus viviparus]|uniref:Uncharacterized protein n=1 Tax=Dictyocaulus viviparus TaxID=29172 RepID=A0A0D8XQX4_DICVI|nr:hypothetical protein DICVIV_09250 [Dictyocaulus viviparus]
MNLRKDCLLFRDEDDRWTDLCACDQPFCNTFSYLRSHTSQRRDNFAADDIPLVFERVDRPDDGMPPPEQPPITVSSLLTVLLVVVPLTVGGATVMTFKKDLFVCFDAL